MSTQSDAFASAGVALCNAVAESASDPADAIRLLLILAGWVPVPVPGFGPLAQKAQTAQDAIADNLRCAACAALAVATQAYQPVSYQDALATRDAVCAALDAQATRTADAGRDATYQALRSLRTAVAMDLAVRGANLAWLVDVRTTAPMPSLTEAWTLYQDTTREPQLVGSALPAHPLFLPVSFPTLSQ